MRPLLALRRVSPLQAIRREMDNTALPREWNDPARLTVDALLDLLEQWHPELAVGLRSIAADPSLLDEVWPGLTRIAIDHAVAVGVDSDERVGRCCCGRRR